MCATPASQGSPHIGIVKYWSMLGLFGNILNVWNYSEYLEIFRNFLYFSLLIQINSALNTITVQNLFNSNITMKEETVIEDRNRPQSP